MKRFICFKIAVSLILAAFFAVSVSCNNDNDIDDYNNNPSFTGEILSVKLVGITDTAISLTKDSTGKVWSSGEITVSSTTPSFVVECEVKYSDNTTSIVSYNSTDDSFSLGEPLDIEVGDNSDKLTFSSDSGSKYTFVVDLSGTPTVTVRKIDIEKVVKLVFANGAFNESTTPTDVQMTETAAGSGIYSVEVEIGVENLEFGFNIEFKDKNGNDIDGKIWYGDSGSGNTLIANTNSKCKAGIKGTYRITVDTTEIITHDRLSVSVNYHRWSL